MFLNFMRNLPMKKIKMSKWYVARSIYNDEDYEVLEIFTTEKECKKYIASFPKNQQKDFFYFQERG